MTYNDTKTYVRDRLLELFSWTTIDSYRVRYHNPLTLLEELKELVASWKDGNLKDFDRVVLCIEEVFFICRTDEALNFDFYNKELFFEDIESFKKAKSNEAYAKMLYLLNLAIEFNRPHYINNLYEKIEEITNKEGVLSDDEFKPIADRLDLLVSSLARELLYAGFSHRHLYNKIRQIGDTEYNLECFKQEHSQNPEIRPYKVVFKLNGGTNVRLTSLQGFSLEIPYPIEDEALGYASVRKFHERRGSIIYYCSEVDATDAIAALGKAYNVMEDMLDQANLGFSRIDARTQNHALISTTRDGKRIHVVKPISALDRFYADDEEITYRYIEYIYKIKKANNIAKDVKERLTSCVRHLRIGDFETDAGQRLLNYWIALEFIFSSPKASDSTIKRLESNLINIISSSYVRVRVEYLNRILIANKSISADDRWWMMDEDDLNQLIEKQTSLVLRHHLQEMKSCLLTHKDKLQSFIKDHRKILKWHIYRIYNCRNRLVHEAAIIKGIESLIINLHYYLVFLLNQLICFYADNQLTDLTMDSFFYEYEKRTKIIDKIIKQDMDVRERLKILCEMPLFEELTKKC